MGEKYQDVKYALAMSLFATFRCDLCESKWAIRKPQTKFSVDKYTNEHHGIAKILLEFHTINVLWNVGRPVK